MLYFLSAIIGKVPTLLFSSTIDFEIYSFSFIVLPIKFSIDLRRWLELMNSKFVRIEFLINFSSYDCAIKSICLIVLIILKAELYVNSGILNKYSVINSSTCFWVGLYFNPIHSTALTIYSKYYVYVHPLIYFYNCLSTVKDVLRVTPEVIIWSNFCLISRLGVVSPFNKSSTRSSSR